MSIIPNAFGEATFVYEGPGLRYPAANVLGFVDGAALSATGYAVNFEALWTTNVMPELTADIELVRVDVKLGPNATGPSGSAASGTPGGSAVAGSPSNLAYLVTKLTAAGGRRGKGRMYLPGVAEAQVGPDGDLSNAKQDDITAALELVRTASETANHPLVVLSSDGAFSPLAITEMRCEAIAATQRRRMRR